MPRFAGTPVEVADAAVTKPRFAGVPVVVAPEDVATPPAGLVPGSREYADWAAEQARAGRKLPQVSRTTPSPDTSLPAQIAAGASTAAEAIPIVGPSARKGLEGMRASWQRIWHPDMTPEQVAAETAANEAANPTAATIGSITGTVAPFALGATVPVLSTILGMDAAAPLAVNVVAGGLSGKLIGEADSAARGGSPEDARQAGDISALVGAASPVAGRLLTAAARPVARLIRGHIAPTGAGQRVIANTIKADAEASQPMLSAADEAIAAANGQPLVNADRFGQGVRTLARTAANLDPSGAKAQLNEAVQDRFLTQNARAEDWITRAAGVPTDIHSLGQQINDAGRAANKPAYLKAYSDPRAAAVLTAPVDPANPAAGDVLLPEIHDLMGAKPMQTAIKKAVETGTTDSALHGYGPVENPFKFSKRGSVAPPHFVNMAEGDPRFQWSYDRSPDTGMAAVKVGPNTYVAKTHVDAIAKAVKAEGEGVRAQIDANPDAHLGYQIYDTSADSYTWKPGAKLPSLQFWDQVQRNLASTAKVASRQGYNVAAGHAWQLRAKLNDALDAAVPSFPVARQGAAAKFGAEDALEAGQKFLGANISDIPAMQAAHAQFSPAQKKLFASGFASSLIDKVQKAPDTTNVINQVFGSPRAKAQIRLALGPAAAADLEHFLRIENIMHMTKSAVQGGSHTVQQLAAAGALGAAGGGLSTGDVNPLHWFNPGTLGRMGAGATFMMFGRQGAKALGKAVDQKVMQSIATSLSSNDPSVIARAVQMAGRSPKSAAAIEAIEQGLSLATRAAALASATSSVPAAAAAQQPETVH